MLQLRRLLVLAVGESGDELGSAFGHGNRLEGLLFAGALDGLLGTVDVQFDVLVEGGVGLDFDGDVGGPALGEVDGGDVFGDGDFGGGGHVGRCLGGGFGCWWVLVLDVMVEDVFQKGSCIVQSKTRFLCVAGIHDLVVTMTGLHPAMKPSIGIGS